MFDDSTPGRKIERRSGRVYQMYVDHWRVAIDWVPSSPILGCTVLTCGQAIFHPREGKVVLFPQALTGRGGTGRIAVRTGERPDLLELFVLATKLETELRSEFETGRVRPRRASSSSLDVAAAAQQKPVERLRGGE
jgi:hypothetical protein